jgi:hypothetical protein
VEFVSLAAAQPGPNLENARCAVHPEQPAAAVCARCGDYHCAACHKQIADRALCERCRTLPGVDYVEDTRRRYWGKRDGFVWYFGPILFLSVLAIVGDAIRRSDAYLLANSAVWGATAVAYFVLWQPARLGLLFVSALDLAIDASRVALGFTDWPGATSGMSLATVKAVTLLGGAFSLLLAIAAYRSPRNALAFKIAIDDRALQRVYDRYVSNPLAMRAAVYGALAMLIPFASALTLVLGILALRRSDPNAFPPRKGRGPALTGITFSIVGLLFWSIAVALAILR